MYTWAFVWLDPSKLETVINSHFSRLAFPSEIFAFQQIDKIFIALVNNLNYQFKETWTL